MTSYSRMSRFRPLAARSRAAPARMAIAQAMALGILIAQILAAMTLPASAQASGGKPDPLCATYGEGFQRVPGTSSCMRSSSAIRTDVHSGSSFGGPNQFDNAPTGPGTTQPTAAASSSEAPKAQRKSKAPSDAKGETAATGAGFDPWKVTR